MLSDFPSDCTFISVTRSRVPPENVWEVSWPGKRKERCPSGLFLFFPLAGQWEEDEGPSQRRPGREGRPSLSRGQTAEPARLFCLLFGGLSFPSSKKSLKESRKRTARIQKDDMAYSQAFSAAVCFEDQASSGQMDRFFFGNQ